MNSGMREEHGFTILEALVSIVIVAIGLLAVAGMQTTAMTGNATARDSTVVLQLVEEMTDRVRVNAGITPQDYSGIDTTAPCPGADPVRGDCAQWAARLAATGLPGIRGQVAVSANDSPVARTRTVTVTVTWGAAVPRVVSLTTVMETWAS